MDLGLPLFPVCVMMVCLLGAERCSSDDKITCPCSEIPPKDFTDPPSKTCLGTQERFRYSCVHGRLRKVGTSNLTRCKMVNGIHQWTPVSLQCIPDPNVPPTQPPEITASTGYTDIPHGFNITTTVTASTSSQMTQMISISASATTDADSVETTPPGLQVPSGHSQGVSTETETTAGTTSPSTTAETHKNSTVESHVSDPKEQHSNTATAIVVASLVIICAVMGISLFLYKRRTKNSIPQDSREECVPMSDDIAPPAP